MAPKDSREVILDRWTRPELPECLGIRSQSEGALFPAAPTFVPLCLCGFPSKDRELSLPAFVSKTAESGLVHVALVAMRFLERLDVFLGLLGRFAALFFDDLVKGRVDVRGHA